MQLMSSILYDCHCNQIFLPKIHFSDNLFMLYLYYFNILSTHIDGSTFGGDFSLHQ